MNRHGIKNPSVYVKETRLMLGLTQNELAIGLGVTEQTIYFWEKERRGVSDSTLEIIVAVRFLFEQEQGKWATLNCSKIFVYEGILGLIKVINGKEER